MSPKVSKRLAGADRTVVVKKPGNAGGAKGPNDLAEVNVHPERAGDRNRGKTQEISRAMIWQAYKRVRKNRGAAGVDKQSIGEYKKELENNLYKLWNRMASGSYFPPPVREVEIPKDNGKVRKLGIPTVGDRVAQAVVKEHLEPEMERIFHPDSYGYRPGKSALSAVGRTRKRCWKKDWVIDLDIKGFFDNLDHDLVMRAVRKHTEETWVVMYIERWLKAPIQKADGSLEKREKGTPQGGVISPLLANLFLHYAFDEWMRRHHERIQFERYADDIVIHVDSRKEAEDLLKEIRKRLEECQLELNEEKTSIVYCKDGNRKDDHDNTSFDFLGYTFRARGAKGPRGNVFIGFLPAMSNKAAKKIRMEMRSWHLGTKWNNRKLEEIAVLVNPKVRGWLNYYGKFYPSECERVLRHLENVLVRWVCRKYKRFRRSRKRARIWLGRFARRQPNLLVMWEHGIIPATGS